MSAPLILGTNSVADDRYEIANSCRFDRSDHCLIKTFSSAGNRKKFTFSLWIKLSGRGTGNNNGLLVAGASGQDEGTIKLSNDSIDWTEYDSSSASVIGRLTTNQLFRDYSAWSHLVFVWDSGNATAGDRMKIYHNGSEITSFSSDTNPTLNYDAQINNNKLHNIGRQSWNNSGDYNGYMAEIFFLDGQALTADSFGEYDSASNIWIPKDCKDNLTFGTNGYYLDFADSSSLGNDVSGNNNDWTINNLTSTDQTTDTPTNNFANFFSDYAENDSESSVEEGNTKVTFSSVGSSGNAHSNIAINNNGKWYAEFKMSGTEAYGEPVVGINDLIGWSGGIGYNASRPDDSIGYQTNGKIQQGGTLLTTVSTWTNNDIIQVAFDGTTGRIYFGKNGTWQNSGNPSAGTGYVGTAPLDADYIGFAVGGNGGTGSTGDQIMLANFGNPPFSISSGNSDANGYGNFEYTVPTGYYALCTKNLAEYG